MTAFRFFFMYTYNFFVNQFAMLSKSVAYPQTFPTMCLD